MVQECTILTVEKGAFKEQQKPLSLRHRPQHLTSEAASACRVLKGTVKSQCSSSSFLNSLYNTLGDGLRLKAWANVMLGRWPESVHWGLPEAMLLRAARSEVLLRPTLAPLSQCGCRPALLYRPPLQRGPWRAARQGPQYSSSKIAATPTDVFVVDFDGVLCNTEPEVSSDMQDIPLIALKGGFLSFLPVLRLINHI